MVMYASLMALAVILTAAGVGMVVFGIPINAFSLGNTLIVSGTTAICGGLILVGLAVAYRQLRRVADALTRAGPRVPRPLDLADPYAPGSLRAPPPTARIPLPRETEGRVDFQAPEPAPAYPTDTRQDVRSAPRLDSRSDYRSEPDSEENLDSGYQPERHSEPRPESRYAPREHRSERYLSPPTRSSPADYASERQRARLPATSRDASGSYDPDPDFTPDRGVQLKLPASIAAVFGPRPRPVSSTQDEDTGQAGTVDHAPELPPPSPTGAERADPSSQDELMSAPPQSIADPDAAPVEQEAEDPEFSTVLKSGVVDGLAYTLYADGSIAAELPEGKRRFASIDELRAHLEQSGT
jgi:hypothetical protein